MKNKKKDVISKSEMIAVKNAVTGEMERAKVTMIIARDKAKYRGEPFTMLFQVVSKAISREITGATAKLLLYLCSDVAYGNVVVKGIDEIAEELSYSKRQVQRAYKELEDLKVVIKTQNPQDKRIAQYHINPIHSWKGTIQDRKKKLEGYSKNQIDIYGNVGYVSENNSLPPNPNAEHSLLQMSKENLLKKGDEVTPIN